HTSNAMRSRRRTPPSHPDDARPCAEPRPELGDRPRFRRPGCGPAGAAAPHVSTAVRRAPRAAAPARVPGPRADAGPAERMALAAGRAGGGSAGHPALQPSGAALARHALLLLGPDRQRPVRDGDDHLRLPIDKATVTPMTRFDDHEVQFVVFAGL